MKVKQIALVVMFAVGVTGLYFKYRPAIVYFVGVMEAGMHRPGSIASGYITKLNVPFHRQEHALSCEIASLKMALDGVGINVPESELISRIPFDPTPRQNGVWGDPYTGFVGDIDGKMFSTGYGVYWDPVAKAGLGYTRTEVLKGKSLEEHIYHINQGRPVVVWGYFGAGNRATWTTPSGRVISGVNGEHARTLIGYVGQSNNPEQVILLDPIYGELVWDKQKFLDNWAGLEYGAVAVYKEPRWVKSNLDHTVWEISADMQSKSALAMDWDTFVAQGGVGEGIKEVDQSWLDSIPSGDSIVLLQ